MLHWRAAQWYAEHDDATEAIGHAIASGDDALSSTLVAGHWLRTFNIGQLETVRTWLDALPAELVATDASLAAARVLLAFDTGGSRRSAPCLASRRPQTRRIPG
jgi:ATP/maltotriose-dependent transcriptional regulator MalT